MQSELDPRRMGADDRDEVGRSSSVKRNSGVNIGRGSVSLEAAAAGVVDVDAKATVYVSSARPPS